jgi:hypothetical protein
MLHHAGDFRVKPVFFGLKLYLVYIAFKNNSRVIKNKKIKSKFYAFRRNFTNSPSVIALNIDLCFLYSNTLNNALNIQSHNDLF